MQQQNLTPHVQRQEAGAGSWVSSCSLLNMDLKRAVARHVAKNLVTYGAVIQLGSGTTLSALMTEIVQLQCELQRSLDLAVFTTNLQVLEIGRDAQLHNPNILASLQMILTGGVLQISLHSLVGTYAAEGVRTTLIQPDIVVFGASGLSFVDDEISLCYQFEDEISTQEAYATRPTTHRVLLCDHHKLGKKSGWRSTVTIEAMLATTQKMTVISTLPELDADRSEFEKQLVAFDRLLGRVAASRLKSKELCIQFVNKSAEVVKEISLAEKKRKNGKVSQVINLPMP